MDGVAEKRDAVGHERARDRQAEREGAARADSSDRPEMQPETALELVVNRVLGQTEEAPPLAVFLGPDDGAAPTGQRKNRERSGGREVLLGAPAVIALMRHRR